jgi:hypothetical protein
MANISKEIWSMIAIEFFDFEIKAGAEIII